MRIVYVVTGILVVAYGGFHILMIYAFSTMTNRSQPEAAQDAEQWGILVREFPMIGFGIVLILWGLYLISSQPSGQSRDKASSEDGKQGP